MNDLEHRSDVVLAADPTLREEKGGKPMSTITPFKWIRTKGRTQTQNFSIEIAGCTNHLAEVTLAFSTHSIRLTPHEMDTIYTEFATKWEERYRPVGALHLVVK